MNKFNSTASLVLSFFISLTGLLTDLTIAHAIISKEHYSGNFWLSLNNANLEIVFAVFSVLFLIGIVLMISLAATEDKNRH